MALLNSQALKEASIPQKQSNSPFLVKDEHGELTGLVSEEMLAYVRKLISSFIDFDTLLRAIYEGLKYAASQGLTMLGFVGCEMESFKALQILKKEGRLPIRVRVYLTPDSLQSLKAAGIDGTFGDDLLKISGIKAMADGSLGARTAWLSFPYSDDLGNYGYRTMSEEKLRRLSNEAQELDLQLAIHGIGDRAIDLILDIYKGLANSRTRRHRIEHCSIVRPDQIEIMKRIGCAVAVQPHFVITDWWVLERIGKERVSFVYPFKTLIENEIVMGLGTDSPVEPLNPWETVYAAITGGELENIPLSDYTPYDRLSLEEALHCYTCGSAEVLNEGKETGTLEPGKFADFLILEKDPFLESPQEIRNQEILEVHVGGRRVY